MEFESITLFFCESGALVEVRRSKKCIALALQLEGGSTEDGDHHTVNVVPWDPDVERGR